MEDGLVFFSVIPPISGKKRWIMAESSLVTVDCGNGGLRISPVGGKDPPRGDDPVFHFILLHLPAEFTGGPELAFDNGTHGRLEDGNNAISDLFVGKGFLGLMDQRLGKIGE